MKGCCGHCTGTHTAHIYMVSRLCESACGPPGGAHKPRRKDKDDNDEAFPLREKRVRFISSSNNISSMLQWAGLGMSSDCEVTKL